MENKDIISKLSDELKLRGYSKKTISSYCYLCNKFLTVSAKDSYKLTNNTIKRYILKLIAEKKDTATIRLNLAAFRFLFTKVLDKKHVDFSKIHWPKRKKKLPKILSIQEIEKMINSTKNLKHRLVIAMIYSSGLRVSELINLKKDDI